MEGAKIMNTQEKNLIYAFAAALKSKFFFCNNYDDIYYQFTDKRLNELVEQFCNTENIKEK